MADNLTKKIFYSFVLGVLSGILLNNLDFNFNLSFIQIFEFGGNIFLKTLKMMVVPIVFFSLISGICNLNNLNTLGRIGIKSFSFYLFTTFIAITISLTVASLFQPGKSSSITRNDLSVSLNTPPTIIETLLNIIPDNPFTALSQGNMLQVIFFSILLGSAISFLPKDSIIKSFFTQINDVMMKILEIILKIAPLGIFCLIAKTFATQGVDTIIELLKYFLVIILVLALQVLLVYVPMIKALGNIKIRSFFFGIKDAILFAFSTSSSSATIPITLRVLENNLNVKKRIASFTVPLGATINMDGTAIMQGVASVFIANLYGIDLQLSDFITIILTATLASVGTAGVPGVGIIMLSMVLNQVGLPLEGVAIIMGVDRFLDMLRTSVNITGDSAISVIINNTEK